MQLPEHAERDAAGPGGPAPLRVAAAAPRPPRAADPRAAFWIFASFCADTALIAQWGAAGILEPHAWAIYAVAATGLMALFFWSVVRSARGWRGRAGTRELLRALGVGMQLGAAWLNPPLAFYFLGVVIMTLGFSYRRPKAAGMHAVVEGVLAGGASVALIVHLGPRALPPLQHGAEWLVAAAVGLTMARAALFGYWANQLRAEITALKNRYRELNRALETKVAQRTSELHERNLSLEQANRRLQDIACAVAHDLRQPIISIAGYASLLAREVPEPAAGRFARIHACAQDMERISEGLLRLILAETCDIASEAVDLSATARQLARQLDPSLRIDWIIAPGLQVRGDGAQLRTVLAILLANAIEATRETANPRIELRSREVGAYLEIELCDNGRGFDPQDAGRLFEPFGALHGVDGTGRTGIGLALARAIAERHRGKLWACAVPGQGACFTLALPGPGAE